jgi:hypothetical protein
MSFIAVHGHGHVPHAADLADGGDDLALGHGCGVIQSDRPRNEAPFWGVVSANSLPSIEGAREGSPQRWLGSTADQRWGCPALAR